MKEFSGSLEADLLRQVPISSEDTKPGANSRFLSLKPSKILGNTLVLPVLNGFKFGGASPLQDQV